MQKSDPGTVSHMGTRIELDAANVASVQTLQPAQQVRQFDNALYRRGETISELTVPEIEYSPLGTNPPKVRLLRLQPASGVHEHVCCKLEVYPLTDVPPFIAIRNARGYKFFEEAIEIDGKAKLITIALERFLRYLRTRIKEPVCIWVRYACVLESNADERTIYWTRDFSDLMYGLASEVFDMHDTNNRLIENGYFERIVDRRFSRWDKDWYGVPDEIVLPQVCPVRLGSQPNCVAPTEPYQYVPLDSFADEIRIICIMPAKAIDAPIIMHVAHCPIKCEVTYMALSCRFSFVPPTVLAADCNSPRLLGNRPHP